MKQYDKGIAYLGKFDSDNAVLNAVALGAIGDAFSDIDQQSDAIEYYEKAANVERNEFTTPLFLFKAGQTAMLLKEYDKAVAMFSEISEKYTTSEQGRDIDKFINVAKYAKN